MSQEEVNNTAPVAEEPVVTFEADNGADGAEEIAFEGEADGNQSADSGSDDGGAAEGGDDAAAGDASAAEGAAAGGGDIDFASVDKHKAKDILDHKTYKKWKKWYKERKSSKSADKKAAKKADKEKKHPKKESKSKEKKEKKEKKSRRHHEEAEGLDEYAGDVGLGGGAARAPIQLNVKSKKLKSTELDAKRSSDAKAIIDSMKRAAAADAKARENRTPPLNRLAIRSGVISLAQRPFMHEYLVQAGFLDQIAAWLCDLNTKELGPLDLRTSALDLLLGFDFEGVSSVRKKQLQAALQRKSDDAAVDLGYEGINSDQLRSSDLGGAVNFVRTAPQETRDNRIKATTLLERMSRTFHEEHDDDEVVEGGAKWPMMNDQTIASPFETLRTRTEAFMGNCVKVDPEDPNSYLKQPPKRFPRSYISGLAGVGRQKRDRDE